MSTEHEFIEGESREGKRFREETFTLKTTWDVDGVNIVQELSSDIIGVVSRRGLQIHERQAREALIALGWTPPPSK